MTRLILPGEAVLQGYLCDNASRSDGTASPNRHAGQHNHISTKPTVFSNMDVLPQLRALGAISQQQVERVSARVKAAVGANERPGADGDRAGVDKGGVGVEKDAGSKADVAAIVDVDGSVNPGFSREELGVVFWRRCCCWQRRGFFNNTVDHPSKKLSDILGIMRPYFGDTYSLHSWTMRRRELSSDLLKTSQARLHRSRAATSSGTNAW